MSGDRRHPAASRLAEFMYGDEMRSEERLAIVRHLLRGCPACLAITRRLWRLGEWPAGLKGRVEELMSALRRRTVLEDRFESR